MTKPTPTPKKRWQWKKFQLDDLSRAAIHDGLILADEPGLGKTRQGIAFALIKQARRVLVVAPGGLHLQWRAEAQSAFGLHMTHLPNVRTFKALGLDAPLCKDAGTMPRFYITSYQDLGLNGADEWKENDGPLDTAADTARVKARNLDPVFYDVQQALANLQGHRFDPTEFFKGIGEEKCYDGQAIRCVWLPTLARVIADAEKYGGGFDCVIVDEGTRLQANDSLIGLGVRQLSPRFRVVLTGTPIKNRLESFFWLAWWAAGGSKGPTARWPYEGSSEARERFAEEHLQSDRFLTREREKSGKVAGKHFVPADVFAALQNATVNGCGLTMPQMGRQLYERVKKCVESFGGRWDRKAQTHLFAPKPVPDAGIFSASSFLASILPLPETAKRDSRKMEKRSSRICNVHRLWKLIAPIVLRRRKVDCGEEIVPRTVKPIYMQPGTAQWAVYCTHFANPPVAAKGDTSGKKLDPRCQVGMQLGILRQVALCPHDPDLAEIRLAPHATGPKRSWTDLNPKMAAIFSLCVELLEQGEQLMIGSPFTPFTEAMHRRLTEAGVSSVRLDGTLSQTRRGELADLFKRKHFAVMCAGLNAMGEGHSFSGCSHIVVPSLSWALDENLQWPDRIWRLDSEQGITIYPMVVRGTIDERMLADFTQKRDSSGLALDGELNEEQVEHVNLARLLADVVRDFDPATPTVDEQAIESQWPALRHRLGLAETRFREFHPPITGTAVTGDDVVRAVRAIGAPSPSPLAIKLAQFKAKRARMRH